MPPNPAQNQSDDENRARVIVEKKTVINLLEAFSVAVKHYLRGEDSIYYVDLYHLVKFLPAYALPAGLPSAIDVTETNADNSGRTSDTFSAGNPMTSLSQPHLPQTANGAAHGLVSSSVPHLPMRSTASSKRVNLALPTSIRTVPSRDPEKGVTGSLATGEEGFLLPARMPPKYHLFDLFPFSLLVRLLTKKGKELKGKKAARLRARMRKNDTHNLPLEISLYLVCRADFRFRWRARLMVPVRARTLPLCRDARRWTRRRLVCVSPYRLILVFLI